MFVVDDNNKLVGELEIPKLLLAKKDHSRYTLSKFSKNKWTEVEIKFNYYETLINFCGIYGLESEELKKEYNKLKKEEE